MTGETSLEKLLKTLEPELKEGVYVFCTLPHPRAIDLPFQPICTFAESEGTTVICLRSEAEQAGLEYVFPCRMITLTVHSSLEAVGMTASISAKLAEAEISANVVAAYYHDHVFVPRDKADEALKLLRAFSS